MAARSRPGADHLAAKKQDQEAVARNAENVGTPNEFVKMLELLPSGRPTPGVAQRCLAILKKAKGGTLFSRVIPSAVPLANKPGGMNGVRCDARIVYLPRQPHAMTIMTKFAICDHADQKRFIIDTARPIHKALSLLDVTSDHDQGLPPALLNR
jgi:hypothetical protein